MKTGFLDGFEAGRQRRLAKAVGASILAHIVFFVWVALIRSPAREAESFTEISWFEDTAVAATLVVPPPPEIEPAPALAMTRQKAAGSEPIVTPTEDVEVRRPEYVERLTSAIPGPMERAGRPVGLPISVPGTSPRAAGLSGMPGSAGGSPSALKRGLPGPQRPVPLERGQPAPPKPLAAPVATGVTPRPTAPATADGSLPRQNLAGATLLGPVANRPLRSFVKPDYPDWALAEAVEATVTIGFVVVPDGRVKPGVQIQTTSGYGDFDRNAVSALLAWRFEPLEAGRTGDQWGTVTFDFRITGRESR